MFHLYDRLIHSYLSPGDYIAVAQPKEIPRDIVEKVLKDDLKNALGVFSIIAYELSRTNNFEKLEFPHPSGSATVGPVPRRLRGTFEGLARVLEDKYYGQILHASRPIQA